MVTPRILFISKTPGDDPSSKKFILHPIDFPFEFYDIEALQQQFPVRLTFSETVQNAQGITLSKLFINLLINLFAPGQLYVAFSLPPRASDVLILHKAEHTHPGAEAVHQMPISVSKLVLLPAVEFVEGSPEPS